MKHDLNLHSAPVVTPENFPQQVDALIAGLVRQAESEFTARGGSMFAVSQAMGETYAAFVASAEAMKASAALLMEEARRSVQIETAVSVEALVASVVAAQAKAMN